MDKRTLRQQLRALHQGRAERDEQSRMACGHILQSEMYKSARVIGGYMPLARELDVTPILLDALQSGKTLALPRCEAAPHMTLRRIDSLQELAAGPYGLLEPLADAPILEAGEIDLLLAPLEGVDPTGMRLGKGGGYYDCLLAEADVPTLGCALSWQWTDHIPAEPWDKPLHACADRDGLHRFDRTNR